MLLDEEAVHSCPITGTVTLLFTNMEGSTRLLQQLGERYTTVLVDCQHLLRRAFALHRGHEVDTQEDAFFVVFARASNAMAAAVTIQGLLTAHTWPEGGLCGCASVCIRVNLCCLPMAILAWMCITPPASARCKASTARHRHMISSRRAEAPSRRQGIGQAWPKRSCDWRALQRCKANSKQHITSSWRAF